MRTDTPRHADFAAELRGLGPIGVTAILVVLLGNGMFAPLSAILALVWATASATPWKALGFARPRSWPRTIVMAILAGIVLKIVMKALVLPLLGAEPVKAIVT